MTVKEVVALLKTYDKNSEVREASREYKEFKDGFVPKTAELIRKDISADRWVV